MVWATKCIIKNLPFAHVMYYNKLFSELRTIDPYNSSSYIDTEFKNIGEFIKELDRVSEFTTKDYRLYVRPLRRNKSRRTVRDWFTENGTILDIEKIIKHIIGKSKKLIPTYLSVMNGHTNEEVKLAQTLLPLIETLKDLVYIN